MCKNVPRLGPDATLSTDVFDEGTRFLDLTRYIAVGPSDEESDSRDGDDDLASTGLKGLWSRF